MLTLEVIEGDGSRTAVSPPTIVMLDPSSLWAPLPPPPVFERAPHPEPGPVHAWLAGLIAGFVAGFVAGLVAFALFRYRPQSPTDTMNR